MKCLSSDACFFDISQRLYDLEKGKTSLFSEHFRTAWLMNSGIETLKTNFHVGLAAHKFIFVLVRPRIGLFAA